MQCNNTVGSYMCSCKMGYNGTGAVCEDVNECTSGASTCHANAMCINSDGSFICTCKSGFVGDGLVCEEESGFLVSPAQCNTAGG
jgi:hypothetical protein